MPHSEIEDEKLECPMASSTLSPNTHRNSMLREQVDDVAVQEHVGEERVALGHGNASSGPGADPPKMPT